MQTPPGKPLLFWNVSHRDEVVRSGEAVARRGLVQAQHGNVAPAAKLLADALHRLRVRLCEELDLSVWSLHVHLLTRNAPQNQSISMANEMDWVDKGRVAPLWR